MSVRAFVRTLPTGLGVVAGATMLAGSVLWWLPSHTDDFWDGIGRAFVGMDNLWMWGPNLAPRWPRVLLFVGVVFAFAVPLAFVVARGGKHLRFVAALWTIPAAASAAYASTLPRTVPSAVFHSYDTIGEDMRWPLLALGIQLAMTVPIVVAKSTRLWPAGSRAVAGVLAGGAVAAAAVSVFLVVMGAQRIQWVGFGG